VAPGGLGGPSAPRAEGLPEGAAVLLHLAGGHQAGHPRGHRHPARRPPPPPPPGEWRQGGGYTKGPTEGCGNGGELKPTIRYNFGATPMMAFAFIDFRVPFLRIKVENC